MELIGHTFLLVITGQHQKYRKTETIFLVLLTIISRFSKKLYPEANSLNAKIFFSGNTNFDFLYISSDVHKSGKFMNIWASTEKTNQVPRKQDLSFKLQIKKLLKNQFLIMIITCTIKLFKQLKRIELSINSAKNFTVIQTSILVKKSYIKFGILVRFSACPCWEVFKNHILSSIMNLTTYINHTFFHENLPSLCKISEVWYQPQWQYLIFHWKV